MLERVDFSQPEPPRLFVSPRGNLLYAGSLTKGRFRVRGLSWWPRFAPWAGEEGVRILF